MSNDKNNYSNTNEIANSSDEVPVNEGEQQTATEAMRTQGSEIKHDNVQPSEKEETQDDSTTIREDDQNKTNADLSAETTEVKENEEQNLKKTSDETNCAEKLQTHDTDVTNGEQPEMSEGSSSEKEKENKKKVNLVKWFKKNVSIHLPKRHSLRKEKSATEHKMEIVDHEEEASSLPLSSSDRQDNSAPSEEVIPAENTSKEKNTSTGKSDEVVISSPATPTSHSISDNLQSPPSTAVSAQ